MQCCRRRRSAFRPGGYYQNSVRDGACGYYLAEGEQPGVWVGRGLPRLGLQPGAQVSEAQLEAIFARAPHPVTGQPLGRAWRVDAVTGFDLTFSAPKSVSALWALGGVTAATQVSEAHRAAVTAALSYLDEHAGLSRRGTDGVQQIATKGLVAALFDHRTSRAGDPQLHTHALVPNKRPIRRSQGGQNHVRGVLKAMVDTTDMGVGHCQGHGPIS
jgi:conjugative relaxase-like TrwC/TraI family protein